MIVAVIVVVGVVAVHDGRRRGGCNTWWEWLGL